MLLSYRKRRYIEFPNEIVMRYEQKPSEKNSKKVKQKRNKPYHFALRKF